MISSCAPEALSWLPAAVEFSVLLLPLLLSLLAASAASGLPGGAGRHSQEVLFCRWHENASGQNTPRQM
jgi:hypothetical protein